MPSDKQFWHRPNLVFFGATLLSSTPFWLLGAVYDGLLLPGLPISALMVACPALVALWLSFQESRAQGVKALLSDMTTVKGIPFWSWAVAMGVPPISYLTASLIQLFGGESFAEVSWGIGEAIVVVALLFSASLLEETGWTGFALRRIHSASNTFFVGTVVGGLTAVWHIPPLLIVGRSWDWIFWWCLGTIIGRCFIVWLYKSSGQLAFPAVVFHMMGNISWIFLPVYGARYDPMLVTLSSSGIFALVILTHRAAKADASRIGSEQR